uniref:Uncharacterized protein n=1 Tax=Knipowitschia caucasica TaxID=637954 RepID=A0AAV2JWC0_KNICA
MEVCVSCRQLICGDDFVRVSLTIISACGRWCGFEALHNRALPTPESGDQAEREASTPAIIRSQQNTSRGLWEGPSGREARRLRAPWHHCHPLTHSGGLSVHFDHRFCPVFKVAQK